MEYFKRNIEPLNKELGKLLNTVDPEEIVRVRLPSGTIVHMKRREFDSKVAIGLSLTEVEDE